MYVDASWSYWTSMVEETLVPGDPWGLPCAWQNPAHTQP